MTTTWLDQLEDAVRKAAERIGELTRENRELAERVRQLEAELEAAPDEGAAGWEEEREEIRGRVEGMVERLEELLEETE